jgi:dihydrofolate reductase
MAAKVIAYIATSLDGYVARKDDDLSFLDPFNSEGDDHGYAAFMESVGAACMGARTYEQTLKQPDFRIKDVPNHVLSRRTMDVPKGIEADFFDGTPAALVKKIRKETDKTIYVVGGGKVISNFLKDGLLDELWHFVAPVLIDNGIPLYSELGEDVSLSLVDAEPYKTGIVRLRFKPEHR